MRLSLLSVGTALIALLAPSSLASTVVPMDFQQVVDLSGAAFAGTVESMKSEWAPGGGTIITRVKFRNVVTAKGNLPAEPILTLEGGRVPHRRIMVTGQPEFELGKRYIILAYADLGSAANHFLPVVGLYQGYFPVAQERSGGSVVHTWNGQAVVGKDGNRLVTVVGRDDSAIEPLRADVTFYPERAQGNARDSIPDDSLRSTHPQKTVVQVQPKPGGSHGNAQRSVPRSTGDHPPVRRTDPPYKVLTTSEDPGTRLSEDQFLALIKQISSQH